MLEPGDNHITLRDAVKLVTRLADPDAWFIRVSGEFTDGVNALIPSSEGALTASNYQGALMFCAVEAVIGTRTGRQEPIFIPTRFAPGSSRTRPG